MNDLYNELQHKIKQIEELGWLEEKHKVGV